MNDFVWMPGDIEFEDAIAKQYTSSIIAFNLEGEKWLDDLAKPFGKDAISDFHVTLVWLGDASKLDKESVQTKIAGLAETYAPISGVFNGVAKFTDSGDGVPVVLTFYSPALPGFRQALREAFPDVEQNHGFTAHTTLAYTCIERDGYTVTIRVYKDIPVPESIGFYCDGVSKEIVSQLIWA